MTSRVGQSKLAKITLIPCKLSGGQVRLKHTSLSRKGKGRCLDRNAIAESAPMSGRVFSNGRCGLSRSFTSKSDPSSFSTKPQGSEQRKSMSPNAYCPVKRMSLNDTGCKACSRLGSKAEREKPQRRCHQRFANSSLTCTLSCQPCPGEKSLRFATSVTAGSPPITVSNTSPPPVPGPLCQPGDISTGTRFLTRQSANWQQYDYTRKDGQLLLSPSILRPHGTPFMIPSSAGLRRGLQA
jgi:hypothetical protein